MNKKPEENSAEKPTETPPPAPSNAPPKKKSLSLDISDVSEVLERKISP
jgi:hypothetical protein